MKTNFNQKWKHSVFPYMDFTDDQDHLRFEKNVKRLTWNEWFYCHPSAYKLITIAAPLLASLQFLVLALYTLSAKVYILTFLFTVISLSAFGKFRYALKFSKVSPNYTFYDLLFKEDVKK